MKRKLILAEVVVAAVLSCAVLLWISGDAPRLFANLCAHIKPAETAGRYGVTPTGWDGSARIIEISDAGRAAGVAPDESGSVRAAVWLDGVTSNCPGSEGPFLGEAVAVNDDGTVSFNLFIEETDRSFSYVTTPDGQTICLNDLLPAAHGWRTTGMNAAGTVVGCLALPEEVRRAFVWHPAGEIQLLPGHKNVAMDINDSGIIVGFDRTFSPGGIARVWLPRTDGGYDVRDLQTSESHGGRAYAINNHGVIVGRVRGTHPFRWDAQSGLQVLPGLHGYNNGWARDVNDLGDVVGCLATPEGGTAVLWRDGKIYDLNDSTRLGDRWQLTQATAINNRGVIACQAVSDEGGEVVLLEPMPSTTPTRARYAFHPHR